LLFFPEATSSEWSRISAHFFNRQTAGDDQSAAKVDVVAHRVEDIGVGGDSNHLFGFAHRLAFGDIAKGHHLGHV